MITKRVSGVGVDAGMIIVMDMDYLKTVKHDKGEMRRLGKVIELPVGEYLVSWAIPYTWNGSIKGDNEFFKVTSGTIVVVDPCYVIGKPEHKDWVKWLEDTNYGKDINSEQAFVIDEMGGDGQYSVRLEFDCLKRPKGIKKDGNWGKNSIQFPRLIAELEAVGAFANPDIHAGLLDSMDITSDQLDELIDRAQSSWDKIVRNT